jgi:hypothetical protein
MSAGCGQRYSQAIARFALNVHLKFRTDAVMSPEIVTTAYRFDAYRLKIAAIRITI